ncbi:MAG: phosphonopyruvate decarboxylase [Acidobacteriota bacterium]
MDPEKFIDKIKERSFSPFMGVPCSVFTSLLNYIDESSNTENYICSSEGEAMGLAGGFALSGKHPVVYMQNDGYGNAVNPLSSLQLLYDLPALLLISWRGLPGKKDAPQHMLMGETIRELLDIFKIPYRILEEGEEDLESAVKEASEYCTDKKRPFALIIKKGYFSKYKRKVSEENKNLSLRMEYLEELKQHLKKDDILLGTTGFTGRELNQSFDHQGKFYMTGSMGCLASIGLGLSIENKEKRIFLLDGDGAVLMKMGSLATIGHYSPENLIHICFDNSAYESTGSQPTVSTNTDLCKVAEGCGYRYSETVDSVEQFKKVIKKIDKTGKPAFLRVMIQSGTVDGLERPSDTPVQMKERLEKFLGR